MTPGVMVVFIVLGNLFSEIVFTNCMPKTLAKKTLKHLVTNRVTNNNSRRAVSQGPRLMKRPNRRITLFNENGKYPMRSGNNEQLVYDIFSRSQKPNPKHRNTDFNERTQTTALTKNKPLSKQAPDLLKTLKKVAKLKNKYDTIINSKTPTPSSFSINNFPEFEPEQKPFCFADNNIVFPEVEYPLSIKDIWAPSYWKPLTDGETNRIYRNDDVWNSTPLSCPAKTLPTKYKTKHKLNNIVKNVRDKQKNATKAKVNANTEEVLISSPLPVTFQIDDIFKNENNMSESAQNTPEKSNLSNILREKKNDTRQTSEAVKSMGSGERINVIKNSTRSTVSSKNSTKLVLQDRALTRTESSGTPNSSLTTVSPQQFIPATSMKFSPSSPGLTSSDYIFPTKTNGNSSRSLSPPSFNLLDDDNVLQMSPKSSYPRSVTNLTDAERTGFNDNKPDISLRESNQIHTTTTTIQPFVDTVLPLFTSETMKTTCSPLQYLLNISTPLSFEYSVKPSGLNDTPTVSLKSTTQSILKEESYDVSTVDSSTCTPPSYTTKSCLIVSTAVANPTLSNSHNFLYDDTFKSLTSVAPQQFNPTTFTKLSTLSPGLTSSEYVCPTKTNGNSSRSLSPPIVNLLNDDDELQISSKSSYPRSVTKLTDAERTGFNDNKPDISLRESNQIHTTTTTIQPLFDTVLPLFTSQTMNTIYSPLQYLLNISTPLPFQYSVESSGLNDTTTMSSKSTTQTISNEEFYDISTVESTTCTPPSYTTKPSLTVSTAVANPTVSNSHSFSYDDTLKLYSAVTSFPTYSTINTCSTTIEVVTIGQTSKVESDMTTSFSPVTSALPAHYNNSSTITESPFAATSYYTMYPITDDNSEFTTAYEYGFCPKFTPTEITSPASYDNITTAEDNTNSTLTTSQAYVDEFSYTQTPSIVTTSKPTSTTSFETTQDFENYDYTTSHFLNYSLAPNTISHVYTSSSDSNTIATAMPTLTESDSMKKLPTTITSPNVILDDSRSIVNSDISPHSTLTSQAYVDAFSYTQTPSIITTSKPTSTTSFETTQDFENYDYTTSHFLNYSLAPNTISHVYTSSSDSNIIATAMPTLTESDSMKKLPTTITSPNVILDDSRSIVNSDISPHSTLTSQAYVDEFSYTQTPSVVTTSKPTSTTSFETTQDFENYDYTTSHFPNYSLAPNTISHVYTSSSDSNIIATAMPTLTESDSMKKLPTTITSPNVILDDSRSIVNSDISPHSTLTSQAYVDEFCYTQTPSVVTTSKPTSTTSFETTQDFENYDYTTSHFPNYSLESTTISPVCSSSSDSNTIATAMPTLTEPDSTKKLPTIITSPYVILDDSRSIVSSDISPPSSTGTTDKQAAIFSTTLSPGYTILHRSNSMTTASMSTLSEPSTETDPEKETIFTSTMYPTDPNLSNTLSVPDISNSSDVSEMIQNQFLQLLYHLVLE